MDQAASQAPVEQQPEQPTAEQVAQDNADNDAAFASGFEHATEYAEPVKKVAAEPEKPEAPEAPAETVADAGQPMKLTAEELQTLRAELGDLRSSKDETEKQLRKIYGKFGDIQAQLTAAPAGLGKREIKAEQLKLHAEYPEIAGLFAEDLGALLTGTPSTASPGITQEQVEQEVATRVAASTTAMNMDWLSYFHEDWRDYTPNGQGKADIDLWLATQPADYRNTFLSSESAVAIANGLNKFKAWRESSKSTRQNKQSKLERNITPRGGAPAGTASISDDAAFEQGFSR